MRSLLLWSSWAGGRTCLTNVCPGRHLMAVVFAARKEHYVRVCHRKLPSGPRSVMVNLLEIKCPNCSPKPTYLYNVPTLQLKPNTEVFI